MAFYGDLMSIKERLGPMAVSSDTYDLDLTNKNEDASDFVVMKLQEFPSIFPTPTTMIGSDKIRLDRITNDLAAALYLEDRSIRARQSRDPEIERWAIVFRRRSMVELEQFIRTKSVAAGTGIAFMPDFAKIEGTGIAGSDLNPRTGF